MKGRYSFDKDKGVLIELPDKTRLLIEKESGDTSFWFPTKKFKEIFEKQFDKEFIGIFFSSDETAFLASGLRKAKKDLDAQK